MANLDRLQRVGRTTIYIISQVQKKWSPGLIENVKEKCKLTYTSQWGERG